MSEAKGGSLLGDRRYAAEMDALQRFGRMEKDAQLGDAQAQFRVANAYVEGTAHVTPDAKRAAHWFRRAAEQGHQESQCRLAAHYADGLGYRVIRSRRPAGTAARRRPVSPTPSARWVPCMRAGRV